MKTFPAPCRRRCENVESMSPPPSKPVIGANDHEQLHFALSEQRVLVTHDDDFTRIHADGAEHAGICYCPKNKHSIGDLLRLLLLVRECFDEVEMRRHLEYL
jgi:hypothetical protein